MSAVVPAREGLKTQSVRESWVLLGFRGGQNIVGTATSPVSGAKKGGGKRKKFQFRRLTISKKLITHSSEAVGFNREI